MKSKLLFLFFVLPLASFCQNIAVTIPQTALTIRKYENEMLVAPIEITLDVPSVNADQPRSISFSVKILNTGVPPSLKIDDNHFARITAQVAAPNVQFTTTSIKQKVFLTIPVDVVIKTNKMILLEISLNNQVVATKQLSIEPASDMIYSAKDYLNSKNIRLDEVIKVESANNILTLFGYKDNGFTKRQVILAKNEVLAINEKRFIWGVKNNPFSLVTVPFKIRPRLSRQLDKGTVTPQDTTFPATAMSGITNIGLNIDFVKKTTDRYFSNGKKSTHRYGIGVLLAPGVEELSASTVTDNSLTGDKKSKQFYISYGISMYYAYNGITLFLVPIAADWAPSSIGRKWIYYNTPWWGFGIGANFTVFSQLVNGK